MKKSILFIVGFILFSTSFAQKFGYIDSEFVLKQVPEYKQAQQEIDKLSINYQQQIEKKYLSLDSTFNAFRKEEILLTEEMKRQRQDDIMIKEKEIKEFQKKIFGYEGLIFYKRQELIQPIQEKVYTAVKKVAEKQNLQIVFDKSSDLVMIYTNPVHDYTDYVLEELKLGDKKDTIDNKR